MKSKDMPTPDQARQKVARLRQWTKDVEQRLPILNFKTEDELNQIKHFLLIYYQPILSKLDTLMLHQKSAEDVSKRGHFQRRHKRNLIEEFEHV